MINGELLRQANNQLNQLYDANPILFFYVDDRIEEISERNAAMGQAEMTKDEILKLYFDILDHWSPEVLVELKDNLSTLAQTIGRVCTLKLFKFDFESHTYSYSTVEEVNVCQSGLEPAAEMHQLLGRPIRPIIEYEVTTEEQVPETFAYLLPGVGNPVRIGVLWSQVRQVTVLD